MERVKKQKKSSQSVKKKEKQNRAATRTSCLKTSRNVSLSLLKKLRLFPEEQVLAQKVLPEEQKLARLIGIQDVSAIWQTIEEKKSSELIQIAESIHESRLSALADKIAHRRLVRIILIAGPTSSGKTTFAKRLALHLRIHGLKPVSVSLDDYYKNRVDMPKDDKGNYDFENVEALDLPLLNVHLLELLEGTEITMPLFDFVTGTRKPGMKLQLKPEEVLIMEGIHGLNPRLTPVISPEQKFKIFIAPFPALRIEDHHIFAPSDVRLIRRLVRDHYTRGYSALQTLRRWPLVRHGEQLYIYPFMESADAIFNSALFYEPGVMKLYAQPLLAGIEKDDKEYGEVERLLELLSHFPEIHADDIPPHSLLREFIGNSCFRY